MPPMENFLIKNYDRIFLKNFSNTKIIRAACPFEKIKFLYFGFIYSKDMLVIFLHKETKT